MTLNWAQLTIAMQIPVSSPNDIGDDNDLSQIGTPSGLASGNPANPGFLDPSQWISFSPITIHHTTPLSLNSSRQLQELFDKLPLHTSLADQIAIVHIWWQVFGAAFNSSTYSRKVEQYSPDPATERLDSTYVTIKCFPKEFRDIILFRALILTNEEFDSWEKAEAFMQREVISKMESNPNGRTHVIICVGLEIRIWQYGSRYGRILEYSTIEWSECTSGPLRLKGWVMNEMVYRDHEEFILNQLGVVRENGLNWATSFREGKDPVPPPFREPFFPKVIFEAPVDLEPRVLEYC